MEELQAYCVKCKEKRPLTNPQAEYTKAGTPGTRGQCPVCGTTLFRMGATSAHEGLPKPKVTRKRKKEVKRNGKLVIVESPAKARTIGKYLGKDYKVKASVGHIRDLLKSRLSVDVENDFLPEYRVPNDKRPVVKELKAAVAQAEEVYLATDQDREGEAIAWHLIAAAEIEEDRARRVVFNEITQQAIQEAFADPRGINMDLVDAQQARRILDRLVGYQISPLLWERVRGRLSAGRVQSVAVRLVVEREREIDEFVPQEYWSIEAELAAQKEREDPNRLSFTAKLLRIQGEKVHLGSEGEVNPIIAELERATYHIKMVKRGERKRKPKPPFTTSTLQQAASRRLGFGARKTMRIAQQLYEGIDIENGGPVGLITYMRTDSTHISAQAQAEARKYVVGKFGEEFLPSSPPTYKTKSKGAQEAHEAVRPTGAFRTPQAMKPHLSRDQHRLYRIIWQRFMASQMAQAIYDTIRVDIVATPEGAPEGEERYLFRSSGSSLRFAGFLAIYPDKHDEDNPADEDEGRRMPPLDQGDWLDLLKLLPEQHWTQPPPRFTEASLVKSLEEHGIGRPSTYAPILNTVQNRGYVVRDSKRLFPTETGMIVNDLLVEYFPEVVSLSFTAKMENELDRVASGEREWVPVLRDFYDPFEKTLEAARENMPDVGLQNEEIGRDCPECGNPLIIRWGRYGKFIGCSNFPDCRHTEPWLEYIGVPCPEDGGDLVERKTRKGRIFYGCANYPECEWTSWKRPLPQPCPVCNGMLVVQNKHTAQCTNCEERIALDSLPVAEEASEHHHQ
jgi:DNA topoisomerase-1